MKCACRNRLALIFLLLLTGILQTSVAQEEDNKGNITFDDSIRIDRIDISKNWITWDRIIKNELLFKEGDWVRLGEIDTAMNKIWNIGNFADVGYKIENNLGQNILRIKALDAVKFYPLFSIDHSSENDYKYRLGLGDDNFLGSNTKLKIAWEKTPTAVKWDFSIGLPRQLLFKNMTSKLGFATGNETKVFLDRQVTEIDGVKTASFNKLMLAPYHKKEFYLKIGNPWHLDYEYRFSPDLSLSLANHEIDYSILSDEDLALGVEVPKQNYYFLNIGISESIGTVNMKRHRKDGYTVKLSYNFNLGLKNTESFHSINAEGEYNKTLSDLIQLSFWMKTGYTTANDQYKFIKGSSDVLGLRTGELYGKTYYSAYAGSHFTWLNTKWISLENAYFLNFGNGADTFTGLFKTKTKSAVGTFLEIRFPIAPIVVFRLSFMYAGPGSEWFKFNIT